MLDARPVEGLFRRLRWWADGILVAIFVAVPWIRIDGEPLILLDVPARKFHVFGLVIFPQELYFLWLILALLALSLFFFTALLGRLWCGWACPQTVFTDLFAAIARRVEGWRGSRPPKQVPVWRKVLLHGIWVTLSLAIGFHAVAYFRSPYDMVSQAWAGSLSGPSVGFWIVCSTLAYLDFVVVRQTFCRYLCPYARFQGVLFDRDSLIVGYDERRGEPRGKRGTTQGDCVDCGLCVAVCPTDIDIRDGLQLECIACTQCIDACNGVMARLGRAPDLIGYRSEVGLLGERTARILRPRVLVYGALMLATIVAFVFLVERRLPMELYVARNPGALYGTAADGRVSNTFTLHIENRAREDGRFRLALEEDQDFELVAGVNPIDIAATSAVETRVFVLAHGGAVGARDLHFQLTREGDGDTSLIRRARFLAPQGEPRAP